MLFLSISLWTLDKSMLLLQSISVCFGCHTGDFLEIAVEGIFGRKTDKCRDLRITNVRLFQIFDRLVNPNPHQSGCDGLPCLLLPELEQILF